MENNEDIIRALLAESDDNVPDNELIINSLLNGIDIPVPSEEVLNTRPPSEIPQPKINEEPHEEIPQEVLDKYMEKFTTIKHKLNSMDSSLGHVYDNPHDAWKIKFLVNNMFEVNSILKDMHSLLVDMNNIFAQ